MSTYDNYIDGTWVAGATTVANVNPSDTNDVIGHFAMASADQVHQAIDAARRGQQAWQQTTLEKRYGLLLGIGRELIERAEELGYLLSREEGKPLAEGKGEIYRAGQFFQFYAAELHRNNGDIQDSVRPGIEVEARREPLGVAAIITPWNFPLATASWKLAPALAYGNAVVWKPAALVPASAWQLTEIVHRHGVPAGVFNLVNGSGRQAGEALINSPKIDGISFTGSVPVGRRVAAAAAPNFVRVQCELGSKNPLVVCSDADLDVAADAALAGGYSGTGQKCTASSRLIVDRRVQDAFTEKMVERLKNYTVGHACDPNTKMGPLVDEGQLKQVQGYVDLAKQEGAEHVFGGETVNREHPGHYMAPALFTNTRNDMRVNREEMFGPIACIIPVDGYKEALAVANDSDYGLTAGICTRSLATAQHFKQHMEAGCAMVNLPTAGTDYHVPFGGRKNSSYGPREQGRYAREFYSHVKTVYTRPL